MSNFTKSRDSQNSPVSPIQTKQDAFKPEPHRQDAARAPLTPTGAAPHSHNLDGGESPQPRVQRERAPSRPMSMVQTYQPPLMDVAQDTLPELQPIFTFLNSHGNKLYQEGYFLKLDDQDTYGRPNADRTWTECFAQLVGTVLSLWDAAELDAAGQDGEVLPKFINLTDSSIKMIESLPTRSDNEPPLQNVLSISTAGKNRYLLHFNSHHSLIQWTAGIRLAMFEHATLQEAYTGALIAGKGKALNNINLIMERTRSKTEDWARVRFGAGTPWRRCWCVITPPDEKEVQKLQKQVNKKKSAYDRSRPPVLKGDIKFYDSKKTKKISPIATITEAYSAFAIYPQAKPLIDASTLVKVEGSITIHSSPPSTTEGFVFVMPEVHPAVTGFEMMLRWLFPVFDTFALYGRPGRLIADTTNPLSLMFAMPKHRRYGYLEILDVSGLILEQGSSNWRESEWRRKMKDLTSKRMTAIENGSQRASRYSSRRSTRNSFGPSRSRIHFDDGASVRSSPSIGWQQGPPADATYGGGIPRTDSAPPGGITNSPIKQPPAHQRSVSETQGLDRYASVTSNYDGTYEDAPTPPPHNTAVMPGREGSNLRYMNGMGATPERVSSEDEQTSRGTPVRELQDLRQTTSPEPVAAPPAFSHTPGTLPISKPYHSPELRRANSRMSNATLSQLAGAGGVAATAYHAIGDRPGTSESQRHQNMGRYSEDRGQRGVLSDVNNYESPANRDDLNEGSVTASNPNRFSFDGASPPLVANINTRTDYSQPPPQFQYASTPQPTSVDNLSQNRTYDPPLVFSSSDSSSQVARYQEAHPVLGHSSQPSTDSTQSTSSQPSRLQTGQNVNRKPLPVRTSSMQTPTSAQTLSSGGSLGQVFDEAAFDLVRTPVEPIKAKALPDSSRDRAYSTATSVYEDIRYDDDESTASPDYASTSRPSIETQKSVEKPRAGVMRTVGNADQGRYGDGVHELTSSIPNIDFGPTMNLTSDRAPRQRSPVRKASPGPTQVYGAVRGASPGPSVSYGGDRRPQSSGQAHSPRRSVISPEGSHYRTESGESRSVAWQPGMSSIGNSGTGRQQAITPEQFVQQRATVATPLHAHQRHSSGYTLRNNTATPPLTRRRSSDVLNQQGGHSRHTSADLLQRPGSRGATATLGPAGSGDMPTTLSAREQEHIARVTGTPLINMVQNANRQGAGAGLVGAIETREREKQQMKQGINSQAVQHAITQRQQQAMYQQYPEHIKDYRAPQSQYGHMGQYPQAQYSGNMQQTWVSPAANVYAQGGGFSASSPTSIYPGSPEPGQLGTPPPLPYTPPQQYYSQQQRPSQHGPQGRGNAGYQGNQY